MELEKKGIGVVLDYALRNNDLSDRLIMADSFAGKNDLQNLGRVIDILEDALHDVPLPKRVYGALESYISEVRKRYNGMVESETLNNYNN